MLIIIGNETDAKSFKEELKTPFPSDMLRNTFEFLLSG